VSVSQTGPLRRDLALLLALGLAMTIGWLSGSHPQFNADSAQYLDNARNLTAQYHESYDPHRPPGYPLFLALTGVTRFETFRGLVAAQALLALAIPFLVYFTLLPIGRRLALATGIAAAALPMTWVYASLVMTEQLNLFLQFLFVFLAARHLSAGRPPAFLWAATLTAFVMTITRPAAGLTFWAFLPIAALAAPRRLRQPLLAAGLYCSLLLGWSAVDWLWFGHAGRLSGSVGVSQSLVELPFAETYLSTWSRNFEDYEHPRPLITPGRGPASRALYDCLSRVLREKPAAWIFRSPRTLFGDYVGRPDAVLAEMFLRPSPFYFNFICETLTAELGAKAAADLFRALPREYGRTGVRGLLANLSLGVPSHLGGASLFWQAYVAGAHHGCYDPDHPFRLVRPENGPATRQLYRTVETFGQTSIKLYSTAQAVMEDPDANNHPIIWAAAREQYGSAASDRLLRDAALEAFRAFPRSTLLFWDNFLMLAAGPNDVLYRKAKRNTDLAGVLYLSSGFNVLPPDMRAEVSGARRPTPVFDALYRGAYLLKPLVLAACLLLLPFAWASPSRPLFLLLLLLAASQYAVAAVMAQAHQRYSDPVYLLVVMAAAIGVHCARRSPPAEEDQALP
jgi:hypothetical protein